MFKLFQPDSKFMQAMSTLADLVLLNIYFLLTCIPFVTIGTATTALYTVCFRIGTEKEEGITKTYFRAFADNFKQGTILWLITLLFAGTAILNAYLFLQFDSALQLLAFVFLVLFVLALMIISYVFPLLSLFDNDNKSTLKNAIAFSIAYFPRSLLMTVLNILPIVVFLLSLYFFMTAALVWTFFYFSCIAYINTFILKKIFAPYLEESEPEEETEEA